HRGGGKGGGDDHSGGKGGGDDHGDKGGGKSSDNKGSGKGGSGSSLSGTSNKSGDTRSYYGQVTLNASGQVLCGNTLVQSSSPWLKLAAPGMWLEASGTWDGETFVASAVTLRVPQDWAYYQGPGSLIGAKGYPYASAWLNRTPGTFLSLKAALDTGSAVRLVAYYDGLKLRAVPATFPPPPAGLKPGWVELTGTVGNRGLVWSSGRSFP
ncbi:MAG: hypothetical protein C4332_11955, partial [Meiothermus sp.]